MLSIIYVAYQLTFEIPQKAWQVKKIRRKRINLFEHIYLLIIAYENVDII